MKNIENHACFRTEKGKRALSLILAVLLMLSCAAGFSAEAYAKENGLDFPAITGSVLYLEVYNAAGECTSTASGFLIDDGMTLVTNYHVIDDAYRIVARSGFSNKKTDASTVIAYNAYADIAVLRCAEDLGLPPLTLGDSDYARQGDRIYAVGYPLGLTNTLSDGIISSRFYDDYMIEYLQMTAAISHGSSGGPLLNESGEGIGVVCASYVDGQNMNIAIASNEIKAVLSTAGEEIVLGSVSAGEEENEEIVYHSISEVFDNPGEYVGQTIVLRGYLFGGVFVNNCGYGNESRYDLVITEEKVDSNQEIYYASRYSKDDALGLPKYIVSRVPTDVTCKVFNVPIDFVLDIDQLVTGSEAVIVGEFIDLTTFYKFNVEMFEINN